MSFKIVKPKTLSTKDIFNFWFKNLKREKPYLLIKRPGSKSLSEARTTEVWYTVKHELEYLNKRVLNIDAEILDLEKKDTSKYNFTSFTVRIFELKKELYKVKEKIKQLKELNPEDKKLLMTYRLFNQITCTFNKKAVEAIVQGGVLNLGSRIGEIKIRKIKRFTPSVDWPASKRNRRKLINAGERPMSKDYPGGKKWFIFRHSDFYLRFSWTKRFQSSGTPMLRNGKVYAFYPSCNSSGNNETRVLGAKGILTQANRKNKNLHLRYETVTY